MRPRGTLLGWHPCDASAMRIALVSERPSRLRIRFRVGGEGKERLTSPPHFSRRRKLPYIEGLAKVLRNTGSVFIASTVSSLSSAVSTYGRRLSLSLNSYSFLLVRSSLHGSENGFYRKPARALIDLTESVEHTRRRVYKPRIPG